MPDPSVRDLVQTNSERYLAWLTEACSIPSLAGDPEGLAKMASWVEEKLQALGADTERLTYGSAPDMVLGHIGTGERTVLVYDHYDVQPVDPLELWDSKPFEPEVRDGTVYARGVADNKGDLVARLAAIEVHQELYGDLPVRVKMLVEGEEETGSKSFPGVVASYRDKLGADGCIWEGAGIDHVGRPEFVFGAKGLAYAELSYRGLNEDQHSSVAVVAPSPVWHLVEALATLRSPDGRVLIDGFYDDVVAPDEAALQLLADLPFEEEAERERLGVERFVGGDTGTDLLRRLFFEPTCNIAGIVAGFTVPGASKTVLPKEAMCKIDMRLVPDQDPDDIVAKLRKHLDARGFGDITITKHSMEHPVRSPADSLIGRAALAGAEGVFSQGPAAAPMMIGTGPMYPVAGTLGLPTVSPAGVCRPDSNIHAPNENIRIEDFLRAVEYTVSWIRALATIDA
ncbi:MAG: M20/M25/M40 family metallo-hydrolase [Actinomycetota bacterium]|nr:M20/M25/M40 family metallo-hydrolase [Actinomycetota bacterium]